MAYGRLDIYFPGGDFVSYMLEDLTVSIGRAAGNTIPLDAETVSRYHLSINYDPKTDVVTITDLGSENGTSVDGARLAGNQPRVLEGVEEIQVGDLRVIYHALDDSPTIPIAATDDDTARVEREDYAFHMLVDHTSVDVWPAASMSIEVAVTNTADEPRRFMVALSGMPSDWMRTNRPEFDVQPDDTAYVLVNFKPPRRPNTTPGSYTVMLQIAPKDTPDHVLEVPLRVNVHAFRGFGLGMGRHFVDAGDPIPLFLHNQGSDSLNLVLTGRAPDGALRFSLPATAITLKPGERRQIRVSAQPAQTRLVGQSSEHPFVIVARSQDISSFTTAVEGRVTINPVVPLWGAVSLAGILLSMVIISVLAIAGILSQPPEPRFVAFSTNGTEFQQGEEIALNWQTEDVASITVKVNDITLQELDGSATGTTLDTTELSGELNIVVTGENDGITTDTSTTVRVVRPLVVQSFTIEPTTLVRYVVSNVSLSWQVSGASEVRITGLGEFTNAPLSLVYEPSGTLENLSGIATDPLVIQLEATGDFDRTIDANMTVPVTDPMCSVSATIQLNEGPGEPYQSVAQVPADTLLLVDGQNVDGDWLRVQLANGVLGWAPLTALNCNADFSPADLRTIIDVPPQPSPMPSPAATGTPSATPTLSPALTPTTSP